MLALTNLSTGKATGPVLINAQLLNYEELFFIWKF
jgi:hypothetical protein